MLALFLLFATENPSNITSFYQNLSGKWKLEDVNVSPDDLSESRYYLTVSNSNDINEIKKSAVLQTSTSLQPLSHMVYYFSKMDQENNLTSIEKDRDIVVFIDLNSSILVEYEMYSFPDNLNVVNYYEILDVKENGNILVLGNYASFSELEDTVSVIFSDYDRIKNQEMIINGEVTACEDEKYLSVDEYRISNGSFTYGGESQSSDLFNHPLKYNRIE